jgi:hypothetical protein
MKTTLPKVSIFLLLGFCALQSIFASSNNESGFTTPGAFVPADEAEDLPVSGMLSNSVTQLVVTFNEDTGDTLIWGSNSFGVLKSADFGNSFVTFTNDNGIGRGGVSGLAASNGMVVAATVIDTAAVGDPQGAGMGIAYSLDFGDTWEWLAQPFDEIEDTSISPVDWVAVDCETGETLESLILQAVVTPIENISWGVAIEGDSAIWAASFAGGFRRYSLATECWSMFVPDTNRFQPADYNQVFDDGSSTRLPGILNHRAFSVMSTNDGLWAGSAGGVSFLNWDSLHVENYNRLGGGWQRFDYQHKQADGTPTIVGNWVVNMASQPLNNGGEAIWVASWATNDPQPDHFGLSWTEDNGATWHVVDDLMDHKIWDIAFDGDNVWVATDSDGLMKSDRRGAAGSWSHYGPIRDTITGREMLVDKVYSVEIINGHLLVGCTRGLFISEDLGNTWTSVNHEPLKHKFFPNPFSPEAHLRAIVALSPSTTGSYTVSIYDFAMDLVKTVIEGQQIAGGQTSEIYWNGRNRRGDRVANGVYFYHVEGAGVSTWGKLMVIR